MHDEVRMDVKCLWRNKEFFGENWCLPGIGIEFVFVFDGFR